MKICHEDSAGLMVRNDETGELEDAVYVEHLDGRCSIELFDRVYHALALAKRAAMRAGRGDEVHARWALIRVSRIDGRPTKAVRLHFIDYVPARGKRTEEILGGCTLRLADREMALPAEVDAANDDPEHPLWDTMLPRLHPHYEDPS